MLVNTPQCKLSVAPEKKETQLYYELIRQGEERAHRFLTPELEQYLVRLLLVSGRAPDIVLTGPEKRLAMLFHQVSESRSAVGRGMTLHELGYEGLKLLGFFPGQLRRRHVTMAYVYDMTRTAYGDLSQLEYGRVRNSSELQAMVPLSGIIARYLNDIVHVLWHTRDNNQLHLSSWPRANQYM